jgi:hypothetical protein
MKNPEQSPVGVLKAELQTSLFSPHNLLCHNEARCFVYGGGLEQFRQNDFGTRRTARQARCLQYGEAGKRMPAPQQSVCSSRLSVSHGLFFEQPKG